MTDEQKIESFKLKKDKYRQARGGSSFFYNLYCIQCKNWLVLYQKDGPGQLFRLYLDRIFAPHNVVDRLQGNQSVRDYDGLTCNKCSASIGVPMLYEKEHRLAIRLIPGSIVKKRSNGKLPAPTLI